MPKLLTRIVAFLLVPFLTIDPVMAAALNPGPQAWQAVRTNSLHVAALTDQALSADAQEFHRSLLSNWRERVRESAAFRAFFQLDRIFLPASRRLGFLGSRAGGIPIGGNPVHGARLLSIRPDSTFQEFHNDRKEPMNVLLIWPGVRDRPARILGLHYLASALLEPRFLEQFSKRLAEQHPSDPFYQTLEREMVHSPPGFNVDVLDLSLTDSSFDLAAFLKTKPYDLIGFSSLSHYFKETKSEIATSRSICPQSAVVVGGWHASALPKDTLAETGSDAVVIGQGVETFAEVALRLYYAGMKTPPRDAMSQVLPFVEGVYYRDGNDRLVTTGARKPLIGFNGYPFPHRSFSAAVVKKDYPEDFNPDPRDPSKEIKSAYVFSSFGCPFRCQYCANPAVYDKYLKRDLARVREELEELYAGGARIFSFRDETWTLDRKRTMAIVGIMSEFKERAAQSGEHFYWNCQTRADLLDEEMLRAMKKSGITAIMMGIETGDPALMKRVKRADIDYPRVLANIKTAHDLGIIPYTYLQVGLPGQTMTSVVMTARFIMDSASFKSSIFITTPYPGTSYFDSGNHGPVRMLSDMTDPEAKLLTETDNLTSREIQLAKTCLEDLSKTKIKSRMLAELLSGSSPVIIGDEHLIMGTLRLAAIVDLVLRARPSTDKRSREEVISELSERGTDLYRLFGVLLKLAAKRPYWQDNPFAFLHNQDFAFGKGLDAMLSQISFSNGYEQLASLDMSDMYLLMIVLYSYWRRNEKMSEVRFQGFTPEAFKEALGAIGESIFEKEKVDDQGSPDAAGSSAPRPNLELSLKDGVLTISAKTIAPSSQAIDEPAAAPAAGRPMPNWGKWKPVEPGNWDLIEETSGVQGRGVLARWNSATGRYEIESGGMPAVAEPPAASIIDPSDKTLLSRGEHLWNAMKNGDSLHAPSVKRSIESAPFSFGPRIVLDDLAIALPFTGLISGGVNMATLFPKRRYVVRESTLVKSFRSWGSEFEYFDLADEQLAAVIAYFVSRPDRRMASIEKQDSMMGSQMASREFWVSFYRERKKAEGLHAVFVEMGYPMTVDFVANAVKLFVAKGQREIHILQDGAGDGDLLRLIQRRLTQDFPSVKFSLLGVDLNADAIGSEGRENGLEIRTAASEDLDSSRDHAPFDLILDYGLTTDQVLSEQQSRRIYTKWSDQLKPGGIVVSVPFANSWLAHMNPGNNLRVIARSIPEVFFTKLRPSVWLVFQKNGGPELNVNDLFEGIPRPDASPNTSPAAPAIEPEHTGGAERRSILPGSDRYERWVAPLESLGWAALSWFLTLKVLHALGYAFIQHKAPSLMVIFGIYGSISGFLTTVVDWLLHHLVYRLLARHSQSLQSRGPPHLKWWGEGLTDWTALIPSWFWSPVPAIVVVIGEARLMGPFMTPAQLGWWALSTIVVTFGLGHLLMHYLHNLTHGPGFRRSIIPVAPAGGLSEEARKEESVSLRLDVASQLQKQRARPIWSEARRRMAFQAIIYIDVKMPLRENPIIEEFRRAYGFDNRLLYLLVDGKYVRPNQLLPPNAQRIYVTDVAPKLSAKYWPLSSAAPADKGQSVTARVTTKPDLLPMKLPSGSAVRKAAARHLKAIDDLLINIDGLLGILPDRQLITEMFAILNRIDNSLRVLQKSSTEFQLNYLSIHVLLGALSNHYSEEIRKDLETALGSVQIALRLHRQALSGPAADPGRAA